MPATSEKQQRAMGIALAAKQGKIPESKLSDKIKKMMNSMSEKQLKDFASTKYKDIEKKANYIYIKKAFSMTEAREQEHPKTLFNIVNPKNKKGHPKYKNPREAFQDITENEIKPFINKKTNDIKSSVDNYFAPKPRFGKDQIIKTLGYGTGGAASGAGLGYLINKALGSDSNVLPLILSIIGGTAGAGYANKDEILNYLNK